MNAQSTTTTPFSSLLRSSLWSTPSPLPSPPPPLTTPTTSTTTTTNKTEPKATDSPPPSLSPPQPPLSSYVILLEHSMSFPKRLLAAEPSFSRSTEEHRRAGLVPPNETAKKDLMGGVGFVKAAEQELGMLCRGRVVRVRCLGRDGTFGGDDGDTHGVVVDLASDPLGWNNEQEDEEAGKRNNTNENEPNKREHEPPTRTVMGRIDTLSSIFQSIQRAIEILRMKDSSSSPGSSFHKSIPVIFDSIAPILLYHSVPRFLLLLQQLKRNLRDTSASITNPGVASAAAAGAGGGPNEASPLILPLPTETVSPYDLRLLEDASDAVLSVEGGVANLARRSGREGGMYSAQLGCGGKRLMREVQEFEIGDSHGGAVVLTNGTNTSRNREEGGKGGSGSSNSGGGEPRDGNVGSIKSGRVGDGDGDKEVVSTDRTGSVETVPMNEKNYGSGFGRRTITLRHEGDDRDTKVTKPTLAMAIGNTNEEHIKKASGVLKPRIYLEDNDPEFDDLDEEDPDDDLDI